MFPCECLIDVYYFGVVVFWVSVGVLTVLVDDFVGFLEDFSAGCGLIFWCVVHVVLVSLLWDCWGGFQKICAAFVVFLVVAVVCQYFFAFCGVVPVVFFENVSACFTVLVLCAVGFGSDVGGFGCEFVSFSTVCLAAHVFAVPVFVNHVVVVVGVCP